MKNTSKHSLPDGFDEGPIHELLRKLERHKMALKDTVELGDRLKKEIETLSKSADFFDEAVTNGLNMKRTQLSFVPARVQELDDAILEIQKELEQASSGLFICCSKLFNQEIDRLYSSCANVIRPFCVVNDYVETYVENIVNQLPVLKSLRARSSYFYGDPLVSGIAYSVRMALQVIHEYRVHGCLASKTMHGGIEGDPPELAS
jgi:hypothetical protein